ncbi:hypothetical protein [Caballeronia sp. LZ001]|uniref:hypothetical protein n=1 Tax=Caballeronia sp. LZ001 TaxID=3038553 RepID=UPI00286410A7|nr:hypothetical protein [Caballeronia sp. LZ001]MDR5803425.1 hypothetical protein [Caballeronia sp. LZ001]
MKILTPLFAHPLNTALKPAGMPSAAIESVERHVRAIQALERSGRAPTGALDIVLDAYVQCTSSRSSAQSQSDAAASGQMSNREDL